MEQRMRHVGMKAAGWLAVLVASLPLARADAGTRDDYGRQRALTLGQEDAGAYRVPLDAAVYRSASQASLADLEVFNADGQPLPTALLPQSQPLAQVPRMQALPWFALPTLDPAAGGADLRLVAERDGDGGIVRVEAAVQAHPGAPAVPGQWLVDASRLREPVRALLLEWQPSQEPLQARYRVEGSNDLRQWRLLNDGTTLLDLQRGGERLRQGRIALDGQARYLRLLPVRLGPVPALAGVTAELAPLPAEVRWEWIEIEGQRRAEGGRDYFEFALPGRFPVERADVRLPGNTAVEWTLHSRERDDASWIWRAGPWMAFQVGAGGEASHSDPRPLAMVVRDRHWRLAAGSAVGAQPPVLRLGYRPEVVVFLAQGAPPYALAAGSANAARADAPIPALLDALRRQHGAAWQPGPARLGAAGGELGRGRALRAQRDVDWKSLLLWALLVGGAVLVAALGLALLRQRPPAG